MRRIYTLCCSHYFNYYCLAQVWIRVQFLLLYIDTIVFENIGFLNVAAKPCSGQGQAVSTITHTHVCCSPLSLKEPLDGAQLVMAAVKWQVGNDINIVRSAATSQKIPGQPE